MDKILPPYPGGNNRDYEKINKVFDAISLANANAISTCTFDVKYQLDSNQFALATTLFAPRVLKLVEHPRPHPHPVAAMMTDYAHSLFVDRAVKHFKNYGEPSIDIGGSLEKYNGQKIHVCTRIVNPREESRYKNQVYRMGDSNAYKLACNGIFNCCQNGAEFCKFKSAYAYSINVNYDVTFDQIIKFFDQHRLQIYDVAMFLPCELIDLRLKIPSKLYDISINGNKLICSFKDLSNAYEHDYDTWRAYLTNTHIVTNHYQIAIEITESIGSFCILRFTRVQQGRPNNGVIQNFFAHNKSADFIRVINIDKLYGGVYLIPDIAGYMSRKIKKGDLNKNLIVLPREFTDSLLQWAYGATDDQYKFNSFSSYARSRAQSLHYDPKALNMVVYEGLHTSIVDYESLLISLFIICAVRRLHRTKNVGLIFNELKLKSKKGVLSLTLHGIWDKLFGMTVDALRTADSDIRLLLGISTDHFITSIYDILDVNIIVPDKIIYRKRFERLSFANDIDMIKDYRNGPDAPPPPPSGGGDGPIKPTYTGTVNMGKLDTIDEDCVYEIDGHPIITPVPRRVMFNVFGRRIDVDSCANNEIIDIVDVCGRKMAVLKKVGSVVDLFSHLPSSNIYSSTTTINTITDSSSLTRVSSVSSMTTIRSDTTITSDSSSDCSDGDHGGADPPIMGDHGLFVEPKLFNGSGQCGYQTLSRAIWKDAKRHLVTDYNDQDIALFQEATVCTHYMDSDEDQEPVEYTFEVPHRVRNHLLNEESTWLTDVELAFIAFVNNYDLHIKTYSAHMLYKTYGGFPRTISVEFQMGFKGVEDGHWELISVIHKNDRKFKPNYTGGYKLIDISNDIISFQEVKQSKFWGMCKRTCQLSQKMEDIVAYIDTMPNCRDIIDMSFAPGVLIQVLTSKPTKRRHVTAWQYSGVNSLKVGKNVRIKPSEIYDDISKVHYNKYSSGCMAVFDFYIHDVNFTERVFSYFRHMITKVDVYSDAFKNQTFVNWLNNFATISIIESDYSNPTSGEVYLHLSHDGEKNCTRRVIDLNNVIYDREKKFMATGDIQISHLFDSVVYVHTDRDSKRNARTTHSVCIAENNKYVYAIPAICGVSGSSKTKNIVDTMGRDTILVSAVSTQKTSVQSLFLKFDEYLTNNPHLKNIVIDEYTILQPSQLAVYCDLAAHHHRCVYVIGDPMQIDSFPLFEDNGEHVYKMTDKYRTRTDRCARKITNLFAPMFAKKGIKIDTSRDNDGVVKIVNTIPKGKDVICFTQKKSKELCSMGHIVRTATESQGHTFDAVVVNCSDILDISVDTRIRHAYVAVSRARDEILFYGSDDEVTFFLTVLGTSIENAVDVANIPLYNDTQIKEKSVIKLDREPIVIDRAPITTSMVTAILDKTIASSAHNDNDVTVAPKFVAHCETKVKINLDHVLGKDIQTNGHTIASKNYTRKSHSKNPLSTINTVLTRYAMKRRDTKHQEHIDKLRRGMDKFVHLQKLRETSLVTKEELYTHFCDYIILLNRKIKGGDCIEAAMSPEAKNDLLTMFDFMLSNPNKHKNISSIQLEWYEPMSRVITFLQKKQEKHLTSHGKDADYKAGQGISAWSKILNCMLCAYARAFEAAIIKNLRPGVIFAYNRSDAEVSTFLGQFSEQYNDDRYISSNNDFTEMDTSHSRSSIELECDVLAAIGTPRFIVDEYVGMREQWKLMYSNSDGVTTLVNEWLQHSGQLFTLSGNTLLNVAAVGAFVDFGDILYACFKGDDSHIRSTKSVPKKGNIGSMEKEYGYKFKMSNDKVSEFIANIVTPHGFFPDVLRRTTKVISKTYENKDDWEESRINIKESINVVLNNEHKLIGCLLASKHYAENGVIISAPEIELLYDYLHQLSKIDYESGDFKRIMGSMRMFIDSYTSHFKISI
jgi:hypothetical protein